MSSLWCFRQIPKDFFLQEYTAKCNRFLKFFDFSSLQSSDSNYYRLETKTYLWHAEWCILKILWPFWTPGCGWNCGTFQKCSNYQSVHPQKHIHFGIKICKLCDTSSSTYDIDTGKAGTCMVAGMTAIHVAVGHPIRKTREHGYKLCTDDLFLSPDFLVWQKETELL